AGRGRGAGHKTGRPYKTNGLQLSLQPRTPSLSCRLPGGHRRTRLQLLRPARIRSASYKFRRYRKRRCATEALGSPWTAADEHQRLARAAVVECNRVRVPHATRPDANAALRPARAELPRRSEATASVWTATQHSLGNFGVRLLPLRPAWTISVPGIRYTPDGTEMGPGRAAGGRQLRNLPLVAVQCPCHYRQREANREARGPRQVGILRGAGFRHCNGQSSCEAEDRPVIYGTSPGDDTDRHRQPHHR